jgi:serine phosphatase RsbU (regulator of sigma subunit)/type II secretory pathway pseudopilin PulG
VSAPPAATASPVSAAEAAALRVRQLTRGGTRLILAIAIAGLVITVGLSWASWRIDHNTEHRLLQVQTRQAASVLTSAIIALQAPLQTGRDIATATDGDVAEFQQYMSSYAGAKGTFVSVSLWKTTAAGSAQVTVIGTPLASTATATALLTRAAHSPTFVVGAFSSASGPGVGYALANPKAPTYSVYAERLIPANRRVPVESSSAFADLHFASYLGPTTSLAALQTTDMPLSKLPLGGDSVRESIPFGDTTLTLVTSPIGHLGGPIDYERPWIILAGGLLITAGAIAVANRLIRRRRDAERDRQTIAELYERHDRSLREQRTISETLQRALLPQRNPPVGHLEIASRYVAGAKGVDVGGDWYSIIQVDETHFGFVVGDVSGRGIDAATHMARVRFTLRAYLIEGHVPHVALDLCSRQLDVNADGHFTTVLIGVGDLEADTITIANAGHLNPIVLADGTASMITTNVGPPLGVGGPPYESVTFSMTPGSTLIAYTDGLVERRAEDLDVGLRRLIECVQSADPGSVDELLTQVLDRMAGDAEAADDIAVLAFTWAGRAAAIAQRAERS